MRHAFLITAYKDYELLYDFLKLYSKEYGIDCYVHIDKKSKISKSMIEKLKSIENVVIIRKYTVNWGSYLHPKAFIKLLELAILKKYDFYHIISANTFLIKDKKSFELFFEKNKERNFMEVISFDGTESEKDIAKWYQYYHFPFLYNKKGKHAVFWECFEMYLKKIQKKIGIRRKVEYHYKGYLYCHLSYQFADYVLKYLENHTEYFKQLKYCHVCEEFFFQNILMNSEYKDTLVNDSLIYDDWSADRERPALLNTGDYNKICHSKKMFIRKIEDNIEGRALCKEFLNENCCI